MKASRNLAIGKVAFRGLLLSIEEREGCTRIGADEGWRFLGDVPSFLDEAFRQGPRELGYVEGRNIAIEYRASEWKNGAEEKATDVDWRNFAVETSLAVKRGKWGWPPPREGAALTPSTPFAYTAPLSKFPRLGYAS